MKAKKDTLSEISASLKEAKPLFLCLQDAEENKIIPWNVKSGNFPAEHLQKIIHRLKARITPEGEYKICFAETINKHGSINFIPYTKGDTLAEPRPAQLIERTTIDFKGFSPDKMIELIQDNADLKAKNAALEADIKILEAENKALEDEIAEYDNEEPKGFLEQNGLGEKVGSILDVVIAKMLTPAPPAAASMAEQAKAVTTAPQLSYEDILNILKANPAIIERLREDLNPEPVNNDNHNES